MLAAETTPAAPPLPPAPLASLTLARELRDEVACLLVRERTAAADFLVALADFDRRRGWGTLGHASLFAFLHRELGLSNGASFVRFTAARLLQRFPDLIGPLRDGRLCLSSVGELSRVLTPENRSEVLPRFYGCSAREAREVAAALCPREAPPRREVVTPLARQAPAIAVPEAGRFSGPIGEAGEAVEDGAEAAPRALPAPEASATRPPAAPLRAHELVLTHPAREALRDEVEPPTADLRRLHVTVSRRFLEKVAAARAGLSHALPGATSEQVLEAALDLVFALSLNLGGVDAEIAAAAIRREVWLRDECRCQHTLDAGGICGSTLRLELDHIVPVALGGPSTVADLQVARAVHNRETGRLLLGDVLMGSRRHAGGQHGPASGQPATANTGHIASTTTDNAGAVLQAGP